MDDKWFKNRQKEVGVTAEEIAKARGRSRSIVSHILNGKQPMSIEWAKAFSEVLDVPIDQVLEKAGALSEVQALPLSPGQSDSDVVAWRGGAPEARGVEAVALALGKRDGREVWRVTSHALMFQGFLPDDFLLVDTHLSERVRSGDVVVAQVYGRNGASSVLRRYEPPVLVSAGPNAQDMRIHIVDDVNVVVLGKVVASWRV